jgi:hypothetical protein
MSREAIQEKKRLIRILQQASISCHDKEDLLAMKNEIEKLNAPYQGTIPKGELAKIFKCTLKTINKRINKAEDLQIELYEKFGWNNRRKCLMPAEVDIIKKYFGLSSSND